MDRASSVWRFVWACFGLTAFTFPSTLLVLVLLNQLGFAKGVSAADVATTSFAVEGDMTRTRFTATVSREVGFAASVEPGPYRIVIDMENVNFELPNGAGRLTTGLLKKVRYGLVGQGRSRIILDTSGPVLIEKSYLIPAENGEAPKIAIEFVSSSPQVFAAVYAKDYQAKGTDNGRALDKLQQVSARAALPVVQPANSGKKVIVIDPGHGGIDPGAVGTNNLKEKDVVFAFALALKQVLEKRGDYDVHLTRDDDSFVSLRNRVRIARELKADLFIAIHADTLRGPTVRGATIYTLSDTASDAEAEALAQKENRADIISGMDLGEQNQEITDVLINLAQRESRNHAALFSRDLLDQFKGVTLMTGKPLRSAGFVVLKAPDVPSVLIELGFLSNREDEERMTSAQWRSKMASAFATAVGRYFHSDTAAATP